MKYGKIIATLMALMAVLMTGSSAYATGSKKPLIYIKRCVLSIAIFIAIFL